MKPFFLATLVAAALHAQVIAQPELVPASSQVGRGLAAYTWNLHVCAVSPAVPIPFNLLRMEFPEIRFFSKDQQALILAARERRNPWVRAGYILSFSSTASGLAVEINSKLQHSASQLGNVVTAGSLAVPLALAFIDKNKPAYEINNPVPDVIALAAGQCAEYTALAAKGTAPVVINPRRIDPLR